MSLFDRHKASGEFFAAPAVRVVHHYHQDDDTNDGVDQGVFNELLAKNARNTCTSLERRAINAGLRAALREALKALREQNPRHSLLDKAYRQKLFNVYEKQEQERINAERFAINNKNPAPPFNMKPDEHIMEDIF